MLDNLFHATRPAPKHREPDLSGEEARLLNAVSPSVTTALRHVTEAVMRLFDVRVACVILADNSRCSTVVFIGDCADSITQLPSQLRNELLSSEFAATVVRDTRGESLWKKHRLAPAFAAVEWREQAFVPRFGALVPLRRDEHPSLGALLLLDEKPHLNWNDAQTTALCEMAGLAAHLLSAPAQSEPALVSEAALEVTESESESHDASRRAEEALRDSERMFRSVVQTAGEAIVLSDASGQIIAWNEGAARIFGFLAENVIGHSLWEMLSPNEEGRREELQRLCGDLVNRAGKVTSDEHQETPSAVMEAVARRKSGGEFPVEVTLSAWQGEQNTYVSTFIRDVSRRHASERLRALSHEVSRILAESPSLDEAAGSILRAIGDNRAWGTGALWLIQHAAGVAGPVLRCVQSWTQSGVVVPEMDLVRRQSGYACGVGLPGRVWAAGEPMWIEEVTRDPHISRSSAIVREGVHTAMGFPVRFGHEVLGVIDLYALETLNSDANFMELVAGFGSEIGQFIARKRVESEIRTRARQQAAVARLGQRALSRIGCDALLAEATNLVTGTLAVDACSILELTPDGQKLRTRAAAGARSIMTDAIGIAADYSTQAGWTLLAGEPVVVSDYETETRFATPTALAARAVSGVSVAIAGDKQPFGVLFACVAHERQFATDDVHFLEAVSNVLAAAIQRDADEDALQKARDEAERARAEAEAAREDAEEARVEAERANKAKSTFLSHMSHELRTPLNAIIGFVQLLEMDELRPEQEECVRHISHGGLHLLNLINDVLEISRIESGRMMLNIEPIALGAMTRDALDFIAPLAAQRDITLEFVATPDWNLEVNADAQRMHEILLNLFSNAVKYNREGGHIGVSCAVIDGKDLQISVSDSGQGIGPDLLPRLFHPFERLGAEKSQVEGTGLGLALTKSLVEAMRGTIEVTSEIGKGTTFSVVLPLCDRGSQDIVRPDKLSPDVLSSGGFDGFEGTILYIEDNPANLLLVQRLLERSPHVTLVSAMNGEEGLAMARLRQPDLILLDLHLPDMHGSEVLRRLQLEKFTRLIPVVIVSADATSEQQDKMLAQGAHGYLVKPLDFRALLQVLQNTLPPVK